MRTYMAVREDIQRKWYLIDAKGQVLGRLAATVAKVLRGKHKPVFTPHVDCGDFVVIVNAEKIRVTGKKYTDKLYPSYTGYPGGLRFRSFATLINSKPAYVIRHAVQRMLPKNNLGKHMLKKLKVYKGPQHRNQAQRPEKVSLSDIR
jgi:large subunit ribosomal protein L13